MGILSKASSATSRAFRRLFGHAPTAGESEVAAGSIVSSSASQSTNRHHKQGDTNYHNNNNNTDGDDGNDNTGKSSTEHKGIAKTQGIASSSSSSFSSNPLHPSVKKEQIDSDNKPPTTTTQTETDPKADTMSAHPQQQSKREHVGKENIPPTSDALAASLANLSLDASYVAPVVKPTPPPTSSLQDPAVVAERAMHMRFTEEALDMARLALKTNETPVGCVIVHNGKVIARGMNATNVTRNGTRHAEFMAISALLSLPGKAGPRTTCLKPKVDISTSPEASDASSTYSHAPDEGNEDGSKGHLYPYGQKWHPAPRVDRSIIRESILYVTVEPCVMCASLLRQLGIKKVYFGAVNDKFGGTGGVFSIHANSLPVRADGQTASAHPTPRPSQLPDGSGTLGVSFPPGGGDGGNIEAGYEIEGGWGRDEAVALLRRFYVQENGRAPVPRKKEGRAARLAAMMEKDGDALPEEAVDEPAQSAEQNGMPVQADVLKEQVNVANGQA
ncbi:hypothetical protein B0J13DRAFT_618299 [Dactylonectria estremocensis]|uniref:CMP/dCMP-type deaminase domain-containing protein n=1 Tax=Dactylonectria estremocensis TaxID=1079267 RepID=A0A9P9FCN6_9HYPO|nr:hypothetical protein B0J13DRAFT_618299 [Dactylonectria estremocensis]